MNAPAAVRRGRRTARRASNSTAMEGAARWGLAARGVLYLLVGALALRIAFGDGGQQADRGGALERLAREPFGGFLVWALGIGLVGMALWRLSEALFGAAGPDGHKTSKRLMSGARFVLYAVISASVLLYAAGERGGGSSDRQSRDLTARAMELPVGQWLVGAAGAALVGAGGWIAVRALRRTYHRHLKGSRLSRRARHVVDVLGVGGGVSRGAVFAAAGVFALRAALDYDPDEAKGVDDTLRSFAGTPAGPWLLVAVAAGLMLFGAFSFALARYRRV